MSFGRPEITYNKIKCEECGKWYKKLQNHIIKIHKLSINDYKEKWSYCKTQPLESHRLTELRQKYSKKYKTYKKNLINNPKRKPFKKGEGGFSYQMTEQMLEKIRTNGRKQIKHTLKAKRKISEASKRLWQTKAYREKSIATYKKKYNTPEWKKIFSQRSLAYWHKK